MPILLGFSVHGAALRLPTNTLFKNLGRGLSRPYYLFDPAQGFDLSNPPDYTPLMIGMGISSPSPGLPSYDGIGDLSLAGRGDIRFIR